MHILLWVLLFVFLRQFYEFFLYLVFVLTSILLNFVDQTLIFILKTVLLGISLQFRQTHQLKVKCEIFNYFAIVVWYMGDVQNFLILLIITSFHFNRFERILQDRDITIGATNINHILRYWSH